MRVSTGSAVPDKADAVIQVEDTTVAEKDEEVITKFPVLKVIE